MRFVLPALCAAALALPLPAFAALSGYYDSLEQIETILADSSLGDQLKQAPITGIEFEGAKDDGTLEWEVETEACTLSVFLTAERPSTGNGAPMVGKTTYQVARIGSCD